MVRGALDRFYRRIQGRVVPELRPSQYVFAETLSGVLESRPTWLDLGCGRHLLPEWMPPAIEQALVERAGRRIGSDLDLASLRDNTGLTGRVQASAEALPFDSGTFDVISANMVMEHVADPVVVLKELRRVLRPGGTFVFHTPNRRYWAIRVARLVPQAIKNLAIRVLEGRAEEDVFPTCYRFNDRDDIARLAQAAGLRVDRLDAVSSSPVTALLGPAALPELWWIRRLRDQDLASSRSNFIGILRAP